ncbi:MAG: hypothetical protein IPG71_08340 [bacterium]|nr:hypothetical protein [bacterium]
MPTRAIQFPLLLLAVLGAAQVFADVPSPPSAIHARDSLAVRVEEGAELTRWIGALRLDDGSDSLTRLVTRIQWTTGLTHSNASDGRIRHDVRWNNAAARAITRSMALWGGVTGQHYTDRLRSAATSGQENSSHVVRGGFGPTVQWTPYLRSAHSLGVLHETRASKSDEGVATWHSGEFVLDNSRDHHNGAFHADFERPGSRTGNEAGLNYDLRQDFDAASHRVDVGIDWARRDLVSAASLPPQLREEKSLRFADDLTYGVSPGATLRGSGDVRYSDTSIDDRRGSASRLEEIESGLFAEMEVRRSRHLAAVSAALRNTSQNIRGEILSGQKAELAARGATKLLATELALEAKFTKYTLDTRSDENFDDRDELGWRVEANARSRVMPGLTSDVQVLVDLNHLVYIFSKNSANNRWTRLFLLRSRFVHTPSRSVMHIPEFRISANYQDYDFETNPRQVRSTVFRRLSIGDSLALALGERWSAALSGDYSLEELGRLYWAEFEEERSDQTNGASAAISFARKFSPRALAALGFAYSRRAGDRFDQGSGAHRVIEIESTGPTARIELSSGQWFCQGVGQWVMQSELGRDQLQYISGSLMAGRAW